MVWYNPTNVIRTHDLPFSKHYNNIIYTSFLLCVLNVREHSKVILKLGLQDGNMEYSINNREKKMFLKYFFRTFRKFSGYFNFWQYFLVVIKRDIQKKEKTLCLNKMHYLIFRFPFLKCMHEREHAYLNIEYLICIGYLNILFEKTCNTKMYFKDSIISKSLNQISHWWKRFYVVLYRTLGFLAQFKKKKLFKKILYILHNTLMLNV